MSDDQQRDRTAPGTPQRRKGPGVLKVLQSVLAGAFGVQSGRRHQEDFSSHSPWPYIIAGVIFTVGFVVTLALIVSWVLAGQ